VIILIILAGIKPLEKWYQSRKQTLTMRVRADSGKMSLAVLEKALGFPAQRISRYISVPSAETDCDLYEITIKRLSEDDMVNVVRKVAALPNVREALKTSD
jgi:putative Mg2+ transporter-C (MgtC) family protein